MLYVLALAAAVYGVVRVIMDLSGASLGYLAGLVGIFMAVGAGIQQAERQRQERRQARLQAEQDSLRRFDERFSTVTQGIAAGDPDARAGAAAALMSFLRDGNEAFHQQTYYYILTHLKSDAHEPAFDHTFVRAFECAAHLVLPGLSEADHAIPAAAVHVHGNSPPAGRGDDRQMLRERRLAVDFSGAKLQGVDLTGLELAEADLSHSVLSRATLAGSCLWRAQGSATDLSGASLRYANLEEVVFLDMLAPEADFGCANLVSARFSPRGKQFDRNDAEGRSVLRHAQFVRSRLQGACLNGADLRDARFDGANIKGASFYGARLNEAALRTIIRTVSKSWQKAYWDPGIWHALNRLANNRPGRKAVVARQRRTVDIPAIYYRRHPYPHHDELPRRPMRAA